MLVHVNSDTVWQGPSAFPRPWRDRLLSSCGSPISTWGGHGESRETARSWHTDILALRCLDVTNDASAHVSVAKGHHMTLPNYKWTGNAGSPVSRKESKDTVWMSVEISPTCRYTVGAQPKATIIIC